MAFADIGQVPEINNELILFRELFNIESEFFNSLLISQGGRIAQHFVEFLANQKGLIKGYDVYDNPFKILLDECEFIPESIRNFIITIYNYRKDVDYSSKYEIKLNEEMISFFESFYDLLNWLETYCHYEFYYKQDMGFKEIEKTKKLLDKQIKSPNNKFNNSKMEKTDDIRKPIQIYQNSSNGTYVFEVHEQSMKKFASLIVSIINENIDQKAEEVKKHIDQKAEEVMDNSDKNTEKIIDELYKLGEELKKVNDSLAIRREETQKRLENAKGNENRQERIYNEFNHKSAEEIKNRVENCVDKTSHEYNEVLNDLIEKFGESWYKLDVLSQKYLITSKLTFNSLKIFGADIDYSGVCLSVTKALELELKKRFIENFLQYLDSEYNKNYPEYPSFLYNKNNGEYFVLPEKQRTLGVIPHILGSSKKSKKIDSYIRENNILKLIEYSKYSLFNEDKHDDKEIEEILKDYGSKINSITDKYRNTAAHTDSIKQKKAKKCLEYVIDVEQFLIEMLNSFDKEKPKDSN